MSDLTPIPPSDQGFQLMEPMANSHVPPPAKFRPQKLLFFLRKFWWIPLITLTLSLGTAIVMFFQTPPMFVSYGTLWETAKLQLPEAASYIENRDDFVGTMAQLLSSETLRDQTLQRMKELGTNQIIRGEDGVTAIPVSINVIASARSQIYIVQAVSVNPAFTKDYLDALMKQYLQFRATSKRGISDVTLESISTQVQQLEQQMKTAQAALTEYEKTNNLAALQQESVLKSSHVVELQTELSDKQLRFQMLAARELETDATGATDDPGLLFPPLSGAGPTVPIISARMDTQKQIEMLKAERERLSQYLLPKHPRMVRLDLDITNAEMVVAVYHDQNHQQIVAARKVLQIEMDNIQTEINKWEAKVAADNDLIASADKYKQDVARNQGLYDRLSNLLTQLGISTQIDLETLAILRSASPATRSYAAAIAKLKQSGFVGLGLGLGIVLLLALRDDRFASLVEVTEKFGDNVVGQVPELPKTSGAEPLALLAGNDDRHMYAESYRNLRSALLYLSVEGHRPKVVIITSAVPNEGKSTVATNLARTLALGGSKVLLVDGDLRKGRIHEVLKVQSKPGFSDVLREPGDPGRFIQDTDLPNFSFLARGGITRNPGDLLLSPAVDSILARFREQYDYILIDSSPVFAADDTSTIAPKADGVLFVVRSRFSHARVVREALELLFQRQARVLGLILNRSDSSAHSYYHYKYAEYYSTANAVEADKDS